MINHRKFLATADVTATSITVPGTHRAVAQPNNPGGMMRHDVFFWLNDGVTDAERDGFTQGMRDFIAAVDTIARAEIGVPAGTPARDVVDHSFSHSLCVLFASVADHDTYQAHPAHQKFVEAFSGLWKKVKVFDSQLLAP